ncbi:MAG: hypothetical protein ACW967_07050, partial [Candidatus Hodarchaeales archaeon]
MGKAHEYIQISLDFQKEIHNSISHEISMLNDINLGILQLFKTIVYHSISVFPKIRLKTLRNYFYSLIEFVKRKGEYT